MQKDAIDLKYAKEVADYIGSEHTEVIITKEDVLSALEDVIGLSPELYESYVAEAPMISTFVETFIGVKAKDGKGDETEAALTAYRDRLVGDTMQYPMNVSKIQASQVVRHGDYVFFVMLGGPDDAAMEQGDEAALKSASENNQIAIDIIDGYFK